MHYYYYYSEWVSNIHRDTYASYVGHPPLLEYFGVATGEPMAKLRVKFIEVGSFVSFILFIYIYYTYFIIYANFCSPRAPENDTTCWEAAGKGGLV